MKSLSIGLLIGCATIIIVLGTVIWLNVQGPTLPLDLDVQADAAKFNDSELNTQSLDDRSNTLQSRDSVNSNPKPEIVPISDFGPPNLVREHLPSATVDRATTPESGRVAISFENLDQFRPNQIMASHGTPLERRLSYEFQSFCRLFRQTADSEFSKLRVEGLAVHPKVRLLYEECPSLPRSEVEWRDANAKMDGWLGFALGGDQFPLTLGAEDYQNAMRFNTLTQSGNQADQGEEIAQLISQTQDPELLQVMGREYVLRANPARRRWYELHSSFEEQSHKPAMEYFLARISVWAMYAIICERKPERCDQASWFAVRLCLVDPVCYQIRDFATYREATLSSAERTLSQLIVDEIKLAANVAAN